ncbi:MAG: PAS domain S-box protein [Ignavibacteriaceae bacterium]
MGNNSYTVLTKKWHVFALTGFIGFLIILGAYYFFLHEVKITREDTFNELKAVAKLKIDQISDWNDNRLADVNALAKDPSFVQSVENYLHNSNSSNIQIIKNQLSLLEVKNIYENDLLFSAGGDLLFSRNRLPGPVDKITTRLVKEAIKNKRNFSSDLYFSSNENEIHDDFIAPIINKKNESIAVIILRVRPKDYLYPLLNFWPLPGNTPENIIVEKNGNNVRFLSELKQIKNAPLNFQIPLTDKNSTAVHAVLGYKGFSEGKDYFGINILAYVSPVPGTNWFLISTEHTSEAYSGLHSKVAAIVLFTVLMILLFATGLIWIYHYRQKNIYRELFIKEKELREYHEEFRTILYSIGDGVLTTDTSGNIKQMNPVAEELIGVNENEALGKPLDAIFNIINEGTRSKVENPVHKVLREGVITGLANHTILISKDGKEIPIADSAAPIRDEKGEIDGVVLIFRDKTTEYHQEKALRESEAMLQESQRVASLGHYVFDIKKGNWTSSENLDSVFGISSSYNRDIEGWLNIIDISQRNEMLFYFTENILKQKQLFDKEYKIVRQNDGKIRWVHGLGHLEFDREGNPIKMFGVIQDITELKLLNEELKESEELFRTTLYSIGDGVISSDNFGNIIQMNPVAETLTGWKLNEAKGLPVEKVFTIINAETRIPVINPVGKVLETGTVVGLANHTALISKDGKEYQISDSAAPIKNQEGKIIGVIMVFSDVTAQYAARKALRKSEEKFRKAFMTSPDSININRLKDGMYLSINKGFTQIMGYTEEDIMGKSSIEQNIWAKPGDREKLVEGLTKDGVVENLETKFRSKSGEIKDGLMSASIFELDGIPHIISITRDISERKQAETIIANSLKEKEILLKEIHHRVKNNFQTIISLIALQTEFINDKNIVNIFEDLQMRLYSMSLIHELIYGTGNLSSVDIADYIERLTGYLIKTYSPNDRIKLNLDLETHNLDLDSIIPCGLLINEVITNSLKYAFPNNSGGNINIFFKKINNEFCLTLSDDGIGIKNKIDFENLSSLGLRLINLLTKQLRGSLEVFQSGIGLKFIIKFKEDS